jgi:hypothetical protein|tara:strand:- start:79 stop:300 length:222 start_codon:yes stop_codon:yes gene_type:complete
MPKYRVTATMYTDLHIDIEASNPTEARDKAEEIDGGEWIADVGWGTGDFKIGDVFEIDKDGYLNEVSNEIEEW